MIIPMTLLSGRNTTQLIENSSDNNNSRGGTRSKVFFEEADKQTRGKERTMEFMYCIPDLEVFIDKTIKKCLLEYDLDANDTEAVLDDMEKAWPKSPPRPPEKQVLRDYNDNTEQGRSNRQTSVANQSQESGLFDKAARAGSDAILSPEKAKDTVSSEMAEIKLSKREEQADEVSNGKREHEHLVAEGDRSDTSSPDIGERKSQARKHPKLKTILQRRYFEGQESSDGNKDQSGRKADDIFDESWDSNKQMSSNLHLLASAANLHTESARGTEEHRIQAIRCLREESEREYQSKAVKRFPNSSFHESASPESSRGMSVLLKLMSSSSSSPLPELNTHGISVVSDLHSNGLKPVISETYQRSSPSTSFREDQRLIATVRPEDKSAGSFLTRESIQQPFPNYKNGFHNLIPQEAIKRELSSPSGEGDLKLRRRSGSASQTHSGLSWNSATERAATATHYNHFTPSSRYQIHDQKHLDHQHNNSDSFLEQFYHHGSRIANIIAEELQKDDPEHKSQSKQTSPSVDRIIPAEVKSSTTHELKPVKISSLPVHYNRLISSESIYCSAPISSAHTQINMHYKAANTDVHVVSTDSRRMPQILPAHLVMTNTHSGSPILASRLGHITSMGSNGVINNSRITVNDDQPQDLSTKPRKIVENRAEHSGLSFSNSNSVSPVTENETKDYYSTPMSPLSASVPVRHLESPTSSCNHSDRECDHQSGSDTRNASLETSGKWNRKNQVQGLYIYAADLREYQNLAKRRTSEDMNGHFETGESEIIKRRKLE